MSRLTLVRLQPGHPLWHSYDVILIDEAQDFAPSWMRVIKRLLKRNGSLFICEDPTQSIFRSFSWDEKGIPVVGRTKWLRVPFRSTLEITNAAHSLIVADPILSKSDEALQPDLKSYALISGAKPRLVECMGAYQETEFIKKQIQALLQAKVEPASIAILCCDHTVKKRWEYLTGQGIYVGSFERMKGLEFRAVVVPQIQEIFAGITADDARISEKRRKVFTAMTRARETLIMSYTGSLPLPLKPLEPHIQHEHCI